MKISYISWIARLVNPNYFASQMATIIFDVKKAENTNQPRIFNYLEIINFCGWAIAHLFLNKLLAIKPFVNQQ